MGNSESRDVSSASTGARRSLPPSTAASTRITAARSASAGSERECAAARRPHLRPPRAESNSCDSSSCSACTDADGALHGERGGLERGQEATEETSAQLNYWYLLKHGYTELVHLIIRPPRTLYEPEELGPPTFRFAGRDFQRKDFNVRNDRQQTLRCSLWRPVTAPTDDALLPCVVYLHGNSSCRLEALGVLRTCLAAGLSVCAFDTAGCGQSDGAYISLGYFERDDLRDVVTHLRESEQIGCVALWGRSMGAAAALLHADRDPSIAGLVVDSAFASLEQLVQEVVERGRQEGLTLPHFLVKIVLKFIRSSVQKRAHFDLRKLSPLDHAAASFVPALFVAAENDSFVAPHHSDQIFAVYGGDKNLVKVEGDHNSSRPQFLLDSAAIFLQSALQVDTAMLRGLDAATTGGSRVPWKDSGGRRTPRSPSLGSSPTSSYRMTMDLDARFSGKNALLVSMEPWACPSCTFVNRPLCMQCEMCHNIYLPDDDEAEEGAQGEARRRATTADTVQPVPAPAQAREELRRRSLGAAPTTMEASFGSSTSAQRPPRSTRSSTVTDMPMGVATATTVATSASSASS